jgi:ABC-type nitrate/sulfonate/bicarbonate transport system substrate-binding protein
MYWFLVMHADLRAARGDLAVVKGRSIGASPWVDMGLRALLEDAGIDVRRDNVRIAPVPRPSGQTVNFGVTAARRLEERAIDGFWANGMGAEIAVRGGFGTVVIDVRRDGPRSAFEYTFGAVAATDDFITRAPDAAAAAVRAVVAAQRALAEEPARATLVGRKLFPPEEAELVAELVRRDAPYYDAAIAPGTVAAMNRFAQRMGVLQSDVPFERVAATRFAPLWATT